MVHVLKCKSVCRTINWTVFCMMRVLGEGGKGLGRSTLALIRVIIVTVSRVAHGIMKVLLLRGYPHRSLSVPSTVSPCSSDACWQSKSIIVSMPLLVGLVGFSCFPGAQSICCRCFRN